MTIEVLEAGDIPGPTRGEQESFREEEEDEQATIERELRGPEAAEQLRLSRRPDCSHLPLGTTTVGGEVLPIFEKGDRVVAERMNAHLRGNPWLDSRVYKVLEVRDEDEVVHCLDEEAGNHAFIGYNNRFTVVRLAPDKGDPFVAPKRRVRRHRNNDR